VDIVITEWALQSYLELAHSAFTADDYWNILRPDVELLSSYPDSPKFKNGAFWGPATSRQRRILDGFKMKWHNLGPGRVQLRLPVAVIEDVAYLCEAYVKNSEPTDWRSMARFKVHVKMIREGKFGYRGQL
jgi:hypothetical protein